MRHLLSLIAGVVIAPLAWGLVAMGQASSAATMTKWQQAETINTGDLLPAAGYLVGAGLVLGLIASLRVSPLGPLVAGLAYVGLNIGLFIDPFAVIDAVPNHLKPFDEPMPLRAPLQSGTLLVVGILLAVAALSAQRWRQWPPEAAAVPAAPEEFGAPTEAGTAEWPGPVAPEPAMGGEPLTPRHAANDTNATAGIPTAPSAPSAPNAPQGTDVPGSPWAAPPRPGDRPD